MTEADWRLMRQPAALLQVLFELGYHTRPDGPHARQLRLFACACCRRIGDLLSDARLHAAVQVAERHAQGQAGDRQLHVAHEAANRVCWGLGVGGVPYRAAQAVCWASVPAASESAVVGMARHTANLSAAVWQQTHPLAPAGAWQTHLLRDVVGSPFRPPAVDPRWLAHADAAAARLVHVIRAEAAFETLPILGDALEEAGCADEAILSHCRGGGVHVRGCWVVELLAGGSRPASSAR